MSGDQPVAQQFMTFLVDQLHSKVEVIEKQTQAEGARVVTLETKMYIAQLRQIIPHIFSGGGSSEPRQISSRRRRENGNEGGQNLSPTAK